MGDLYALLTGLAVWAIGFALICKFEDRQLRIAQELDRRRHHPAKPGEERGG